MAEDEVARVPAPVAWRKRFKRSHLARLLFLLPLILYLLIFYGYPLWYSIQISLEDFDLQAEITGVASFIGLV